MFKTSAFTRFSRPLFFNPALHTPRRWIHAYFPPINQGIKGKAVLFTGNFAYFTKLEAAAIKANLLKSNVFVLLYDRDSIDVPANERATWIREYFKHHPNLEVRVAYGVPDEKNANADTYAKFIEKQLPPAVSITAVSCNQRYSALLAAYLKASFKPNEHLKDLGLIEQFIKNTNSDPKDYLFDFVKKRVVSPFKNVIDGEQFEQQYLQLADTVKRNIETLNPHHPNQDMFYARVPWNTNNLNRLNLPIIIGEVAPQDRSYFDQRTNAQVFDMPIYMPNQGWKIPVELSPYVSTIQQIVAAESLANPKMKHCITYVTTDYGIVPPAGFARRAGLHVDGFLTKANSRTDQEGQVWGDYTYVVSNQQRLQTEFYPGPFDLSEVDTENPKAVLQHFATQGASMPYTQSNAYEIARLSCNTVHSVHPNMTDKYLERSFLKVTFSYRLFNLGAKTINPALLYRFIFMPRTDGRNVQNLSGAAPAGYEMVDLCEINFSSQLFPAWTAQQYQLAVKNSNIVISAVPAIEGEILETRVNNDIVTTNVARAGDMKVTRTDGDSYFLGRNFNQLYKPVAEGKYSPTERTLKSLRVLKNISFVAQWGTRQNIPAGGYIVQDNEGESWGVHEESFEASYRLV